MGAHWEGVSMTAKVVAGTPKSVLGEGPVWVESIQQLVWVDIVGQSVHHRSLDSNFTETLALDEPIGWVLPTHDQAMMIAGMKSGFWEFDLVVGKRRLIGDPEPDRPDNRLNDAKVDSGGRIWAGSKDDTDRAPSGALYRLDHDLAWHRIDDGYGVANGPTFSPDGLVLYHTDSARRVIYRFDMDASGRLDGKRVWIEFPESWGSPDGMTTDEAGCIWVAHWGGGCISRFDADANLLARYDLPARNVTSCCFAGPARDRLFVTTAALDDEESAYGGCLFELEPGVTGAPTAMFGGQAALARCHRN